MNFMIGLFHQIMAEEKEMDIEFQRRANKARDDYFEASKFPRKKKKRVRKEAKDDYNFYMSVINFNKLPGHIITQELEEDIEWDGEGIPADIQLRNN